MNASSFKNVALRTFKSAPKTSVIFKSIVSTYNTATGVNDDVETSIAMSVMLRSKFSDDVNNINSTVHTITGRQSDFTTTPNVEDTFAFGSTTYIIQNIAEDHVGGLYTFVVEI